MPPLSYLGCPCTGHGAFPPRPIVSGSANVFVNGSPASAAGDGVAVHKAPKKPPHGGAVASGSSSVFINGKPAARIGDAVSCGSAVAMGSANVFVGG